MFKKLDKKEDVMNFFVSQDKNVSFDDESLISKDIEEHNCTNHLMNEIDARINNANNFVSQIIDSIEEKEKMIIKVDQKIKAAKN